MEETVVIKKAVIKVEKATEDSDTIKRMKLADNQLAGKKAISFYCSKRHEFIFIENTREQSINYAPRFQKVEISVQDITSKEKLKEWQEQH